MRKRDDDLVFPNAAFRPNDEVCVVRAVARQRDVLLTEQASWVQRMPGPRSGPYGALALVQMNIQLTEVLTDVMGMTGQAIIRAILAGERDPKVLARHRNGRGKASEQDIARALTGNLRGEHRVRHRTDVESASGAPSSLIKVLLRGVAEPISANAKEPLCKPLSTTALAEKRWKIAPSR